VVNFIMEIYFATNFTSMKKNSKTSCGSSLNLTSSFLYNVTAVKKCSSNQKKGSLFFDLKTLVELLVKCSESNDRASISKMTNGSMKVIV
jgi:hypothetical protein